MEQIAINIKRSSDPLIVIIDAKASLKKTFTKTWIFHIWPFMYRSKPTQLNLDSLSKIVIVFRRRNYSIVISKTKGQLLRHVRTTKTAYDNLQKPEGNMVNFIAATRLPCFHVLEHTSWTTHEWNLRPVLSLSLQGLNLE